MLCSAGAALSPLPWWSSVTSMCLSITPTYLPAALWHTPFFTNKQASSLPPPTVVKVVATAVAASALVPQEPVTLWPAYTAQHYRLGGCWTHTPVSSALRAGWGQKGSGSTRRG